MSPLPWSERPVEEARLLNPPFLALLIWSCARGYEDKSGRGVPFPLLFVAMPAALHKETRGRLPRAVSAQLPAWLAEHPHLLVRFAERAAALVPLVREGILFGANGGLLDVSPEGIAAAPRPRTMAAFMRDATAEVRECVKKAELVGKWFARSGDYSTVMALWGVAP
jgi:hypothetical protein